MKQTISQYDIVCLVGDAVVDLDYAHFLDKMNGEKILLIGNHDEGKVDDLKKYFSKIDNSLKLTLNWDEVRQDFFLNLYPTRGRVQKNMINASVDVWDYTPVSTEQIFICKEAIEKFYDEDAWCANEEINKAHDNRGKAGRYR